MFGIEFPYFNMQQLNLDWVIDKIKGMLSFLPDDGTAGQILRRTADGAEWSDETGDSVESVNGKTGVVVLDSNDILMDDNSSVEDAVSDLKSTFNALENEVFNIDEDTIYENVVTEGSTSTAAFAVNYQFPFDASSFSHVSVEIHGTPNSIIKVGTFEKKTDGKLYAKEVKNITVSELGTASDVFNGGISNLVVCIYGDMYIKNVPSGDYTYTTCTATNWEDYVLYPSLGVSTWTSTNAYIDYYATIKAYTKEDIYQRKIKNYITVGASNCDYTNIQDAIDNANDSATNPVTILVKQGIYSRFVCGTRSAPRYINIIGDGESNTIVRDTSGDYDLTCANVRINGLVKGITFVEESTAESWSASGSDPYVYAVHIDFGTCKTDFENCTFESNCGPSVGIGLDQDMSLRFVNCAFKCTANTFGGNDLGAIYCHTSPLNNKTNQYISLSNCIAVNTYGDKGIYIGIVTMWQGNPVTGGTYEALLQNCGSFGANGASWRVDAGILSQYSYGNVYQ